MRTKTGSIITICSSANFYKKAVEIQADLQKLGYQTIIPSNAERMKKTGDNNAEKYRTWLKQPTDYHKKTALIREHFSEIEKGDVILVLNEEKNGVTNYIGGNVLIEMALAFYLGKPIFILNDLPHESSYLEEIIALNPIVLHGQLDEFRKAVPVSPRR